jgi:spore maturation protein CgeB
MKLVIFGLTISSSWGNGHATVLRGLLRALAARRRQVVFYEQDVPYYAHSRDLTTLPGVDLQLYADWPEIAARARRHLRDADVAMVISFCPHGAAATELMVEAGTPVKVYYDLDTPVTLARLAEGEKLPYIGPHGLREFDLVLSHTGGAALRRLQQQLGARRVAPFYGSVDPELHRPVASADPFRCDLSYLGTYAEDRQAALEMLFVEPARRLPQRRFLLGGSLYPNDFPWTPNLYFRWHVAPPDHSLFYSSSRLTLNVTRRPMVEMGYSAPIRLFEAAACGTPVLTDAWEGLDHFFAPGREILVARSTDEAVAAIEMDDQALQRIGRAARERVLADHTVAQRARQLEQLLEEALARSPDPRKPSQDIRWKTAWKA